MCTWHDQAVASLISVIDSDLTSSCRSIPYSLTAHVDHPANDWQCLLFHSFLACVQTSPISFGATDFQVTKTAEILELKARL